jgi:hypothetical protein
MSTDVLEEHAASVFSACHMLHTGFLLGLIFDLEDGGDIFLYNVN